MNGLRKLEGKRIAVLATDGFEKVELASSVDALKQAGAKVEVVALHPGRIRGMNVHQPADLVQVDKTVNDAIATDYDGLLIPGGYISPDLLRQSALVRAFVRAMSELGKPVAMMSQAPSVLTSSGLAANRRLTASPGMRDDLVNAGAIWLNEPVVRDGTWLTGRGQQDTDAFIRELIPFFHGAQSPSAPPAKAMSDPPLEEPSGIQGQSLQWLSTPSVGAMLGLALLGVGVVAANRGRRKKLAQVAGPEPPPA